MVECAECGQSNSLSRKCSRCGSTFCSEHRLPESHDCPGLAFEQASSRWFEDRDAKPIGRQEPSSDEKPGEMAWRCVDCGALYTTNQHDCVRCDGTVFEPAWVTDSEYEELRPSSARRRRRERKKRRREERNAKRERDAEDAERGTSPDTDARAIGLWRFNTSILSRLLSIIGGTTNRPISSFDTEVWVEDVNVDRTADYLRIRPTDSGEGRKYRVETYSSDGTDDGQVQLKKTGTRLYTDGELATRLPGRVTRIDDGVWDPASGILETGSSG